MKASPILCGVIVALAAFASSAAGAPVDQFHLAPGVQAVAPSDASLSDQVNALQAKVNQLTALVQKLQSQLAQTTKAANDAYFKAGLATMWINTNGDKLLKAASSGNTNGAAGDSVNPSQLGGVGSNPPVPSTDAADNSSNASPPQNGDPFATSGPGSTLCNVADVHTYPDRLHIRCMQPTSGAIYYFATESNSAVAQLVQVANAVGVTGLINRTVQITYDANPGANPAGCLTTDCRRLLGVKS
jgi:hypothetical protein